jgi:hypothetical protein
VSVDDRLVDVQDAAIERALAADDGVRRHLELAGALEVARGRDGDVGDETFATAMCCLVAVAALPDDPLPPAPVSPPSPGDGGDFLALGADVAVERHGADRERLARLAGVSLATL